jgi:hypothetical protein
MIKITCLSGPYAGQTKEIPVNENPREIFLSFLRHNWDWKVDYSQATDEEIFKWLREEIAVRIVRALLQKRPVYFLDKKYRLQEGEDLKKIVEQIENEIGESGRTIFIEKDDKKGLVIGVGGYEH